MYNKELFADLLYKYINGSLTAEENNTLRRLLGQSESDPELERILWESFQQSGDNQFWSDEFRQSFADRISQRAFADNVAQIKPVHRTHFLRRGFFRYAAAVILAVGAISVAYFWRTNKKPEPTLVNENKPLQTDIAPGGEKAILTLADGRKIILDNAANGNLAQQGNARVVKLANGHIAYNLNGLAEKSIMWNTMSTPVGGQYQVTLPDETKVWLNAASSISYPTAFAGKERKVKVTGEAYFEVAKNRLKPFIVDIDGKAAVEVLGTTFNINSYGDEGTIKTSLVEGSVKMTKGNKNALLKPGYQAVVALLNQQSGDNSIQIQPVDLDRALAWKNGIFDFTGADLRSVMKQLERWYDIKVQYKGSMPNITFEGKMYRNVNLSDVLEMLQKMGVKFELKGKNLIVL